VDPENVWTFWRTKKLLTPSGIRSLGHQAYSVVAIPTTLSLVPQITEQNEKYREEAKKKGGGVEDAIGNKRKERGEKGGNQEHRSGAKGTVESPSMKKIKKRRKFSF
jgi:hypothetical protein